MGSRPDGMSLTVSCHTSATMKQAHRNSGRHGSGDGDSQEAGNRKENESNHGRDQTKVILISYSHRTSIGLPGLVLPTLVLPELVLP